MQIAKPPQGPAPSAGTPGMKRSAEADESSPKGCAMDFVLEGRSDQIHRGAQSRQLGMGAWMLDGSTTQVKWLSATVSLSTASYHGEQLTSSVWYIVGATLSCGCNGVCLSGTKALWPRSRRRLSSTRAAFRPLRLLTLLNASSISSSFQPPSSVLSQYLTIVVFHGL